MLIPSQRRAMLTNNASTIACHDGSAEGGIRLKRSGRAVSSLDDLDRSHAVKIHDM